MLKCYLIGERKRGLALTVSVAQRGLRLERPYDPGTLRPAKGTNPLIIARPLRGKRYGLICTQTAFPRVVKGAVLTPFLLSCKYLDNPADAM